MRTIVLLIAIAMLAACSSARELPDGVAAWCGSVEYTGTFTKSESSLRGVGLTDAEIAAALTADQVIQLADAMGCNEAR